MTKNNFIGALLLIFIGVAYYLNYQTTKSKIVRLKDGHQYNRTFEGMGSYNYQHLEGCDHINHKK